MAFEPKFDRDPESWRRCIDCEGRPIIRLASEEQKRRHIGHHMIYATGFRVNECIRILLGWL